MNDPSTWRRAAPDLIRHAWFPIGCAVTSTLSAVAWAVTR